MPAQSRALRLLPALLLLCAGPALAHFYPETPTCRPPKKPLEFVTDLDKQQFDAKVDAYRTCLENFVKKQNEATQKHQAAADKAAVIWKQYVEQELGATLKQPGEDAGSEAVESQ